MPHQDRLVFSGQWIIEGISVTIDHPGMNAIFAVEGSDSSDGYYEVLATESPPTFIPPVVVSGERWSLRGLWLLPPGAAFPTVPIQFAPTDSNYTRAGGLVKVLKWEGTDLGTVALRCRHFDPRLNTEFGLEDVPNFTFPDDLRVANTPCARPANPGAAPGHGGLGQGGPGFNGLDLDCDPSSSGGCGSS